MKTYKDGPVSLQTRSCTDKICLFIFFLFTLVMLCIAIFAWSQGNFSRLTKAYDPDGKGCGVDYPNYPYIYFASPSYDTLWVTVCVSQCPKQADTQLKCQTNTIVKSCSPNNSQNKSQVVEIYDSSVCNDDICLPTSKVLSDRVSEGLGNSASGLSALFQNYQLILFAFPIAILMAVAVMVLVRFTACCFVYILILLAVGGLVGLGVFLITQNFDAQSGLMGNQKLRLIIGILSIALGAIVLILMCCLRNRISLASKIVEVAAIFVAKNCLVVFLPLLLFIITILFIALWTVEALGYYSLGKPTSNARHYPFQNFELTKEIYIILIVHVLYLFWVIFFLIDTGGFLISGTAASWYYSRQSPYGQTSERYRSKHMGSVCAGSFFKALLAFVKFMYEILTPEVQADGDGWKSKMKKCCDCICCLCMKLFDWLNGGAYTVINITGDDYCSSAMKGVEIRLKNLAVTGIITILQTVFSIIIRLAITALTVLMIDIISTKVQKYKMIGDRTILFVVVGLIGFAISSFFSSVYSDSVEALLVTYLLDIQSGGSKSNAPQQLREFLQQARKEENIISN